MAEMRVKDFTYYPLMSEGQCAFRIKGRRETYHQCQKYAQIGIEGHRFCKHHAEHVRTVISNKEPTTNAHH